jgi:hypothetical protein
MKNTPLPLVRLNLHLRTDYLDRLAALAKKISGRKGRETRLAEALELTLTAGLNWTDTDLLGLLRSDAEQPHWLALGPIFRARGTNCPSPEVGS